MAATTSSPGLPLLLLLLLLAVSASARPCKTLLFFSSSSTSFYPIPSSTLSQNPNPNPRYLTFYFTSTSNYPSSNRFFLIPKPFTSPIFFGRIDGEEQQSMNTEQEDVERQGNSLSDMPLRLHTTVRSSVKDRSKDILSVVGALLFGMGCGALTAATMYLLWSLFMPNRFEFEDSDDDDDLDSFDDLDDPKKMMMGGYVAIPTKVVDDEDLKKPVNEVAKEGA